MAAAQGRVVITGGSGNLGSKFAKHLASIGFQPHILEQPGWLQRGALDPGWRATEADMRRYGAWVDELSGARAIVHFAAQNPYPTASWQDVAESMAMTNSIMLAAVAQRVPRVVFASSNHVMGGHKDDGSGVRLATGAHADSSATANAIGPGTGVEVGTKWRVHGETEMDSTPYATAKLAGEQLARTLAQQQRDTSFVCVRIGWCQPGDNTPATMSASGTPELEQQHAAPSPGADACAAALGAADPDGSGRDQGTGQGGDTHADPQLLDKWYRLMWLSNGDFNQIMTRAVEEKCAGARFFLVNGMSNNTGMRWSTQGWKQLGYAPADDVSLHVDV